jgi:autotransporter-associated beta strand protein
MLKTKQLTKSLLAAAAALAIAAPLAKAYDVTGWNTTSYTSGSTYAYGPYNTGGGAWIDGQSSSIDSLFGGSMDLNLVYSGLYNVSGLVNWSNNRYGVNTPDWAQVSFQINGSTQQLSTYPSTADYSWRSSAYFLPINNATVRVNWNLAGDNGTWVNAGYYALTERAVQIARTGAGLNGQSATSAFASDNQAYGNNYSVYSNRNVLRTQSYILTNAPVGSVVRNGDIQLGNLGAYDALFAKDAGWLDIRGSLTISSGLGQVYIRDAEITSTVFTDSNSYGSAQARTQGNFFFDSGILSVRNRFAQDMYVSGGQTVAFRDGAVNATSLFLDGQGYTAGSGSYGSLRSISGSNTQNGNIGIGWNGNDSTIGVDTGSTLTVNGTINSVNGAGSGGGNSLIFNVDGQLNQNGTIASGVSNLTKNGSGDVRLSAVNTFGGNLYVQSGSVTVGNVGALSGATVDVASGAALVFDAGDMTVANNIRMATSWGSQPAVLRVASGDVVANNVDMWGMMMGFNDVAKFQTDANTSLDLSTQSGMWHLDAGLSFVTAADSFINVHDIDLVHIDISKSGAGILHLHTPNSAIFTITATQGSIVFHDTYSTYGWGMNGSSASGVASGSSFVFDAGSSAGSIAFSGPLRIAGSGDAYNGYLGAIHNAVGSNTVASDITVTDSAVVYAANSSSLTLSGLINGTGNDLTLRASSAAAGASYGTITLSGNVSNLDTLVKTGNGVAILSGSNGIAEVSVQAGLLVAASNGALGSSASVASGASLVVTAANAHGDITLLGTDGFGSHAYMNGVNFRSLNFTGNSGQDGTITLTADAHIAKITGAANTATIAGNITSSASVAPTLAFHVDAGTLAVSGNIGSSVGAITKYGNGTTLAVSGNINTTADLNVTEGTVALSGTAANVNVNVASGATLEINASNVFNNSASSGLTLVDVASGGSLVLGANGSTVTDTILSLTGSGNVSLLHGSTLNVLSGNYTGVVQSSGTLVKDGASSTTLLLTGASTYLGGTTVQGGTLNLANVGSLTSNVVVANGGTFVANGHVLADIPNDIDGNVTVNTGGLLKGSGIIAGGVTNSGVVAPGNSPGILTVNGAYLESGILQVEIGGTAGAGVNPNGHDQIHVTGGNYTITAGVATLELSKYNAFEPARRDSFLAVNVDAPFAIVGQYHTLDRSSFSSQLFFDHSNGKVYGSGLTEAQTFAEYGLTNANRRAVGYALYQDGLITAATVKNGAGSATSGKAFVNGSTDLGAAVESLLLAVDPATVLDALSPEAYAGLGDAAGRISRAHFSTLGSALTGANQTWDFAVGYTDQRFRTGTSTTSLDQQMTDSSTHVSANKSFGTDCGLAVLLSDERGHVNASNFAGSMTGWSAGIAGSYRTKEWNFQVGYVHTNGSADVVRNGAAANDIAVRADSVQLTVTPVAKVDPKATYVLTPYASLVYTRTKSDAVTESSPGANLKVDAISADSVYAELGANLAGKFMPDLQWNLSAALATSLNGSQTDVTARFADAGVGATAFSVRSGGVHGLEAKLGANLVKDFGSNTRGEIGVLGEVGSNFSNAIRFDAKVSKRF